MLQSLGWIALVWSLRVKGDETVLGWIMLATFVIGVPFLALWPAITLRPDGELRLRDWLQVRRAHVDDIARLAMTQYGLRFEFADRTRFTSVLFQATLSWKRPRVLGFIDAVTQGRNMRESFNPWDAAQPGGLELYERRKDGAQLHRPGQHARSR